MLDTLRQDIRFGLRTLRKNLLVTILATGSLALAVAGNTTVYSLVNSFLNRPLPYTNVNRLVFVGERNNTASSGQLLPISPVAPANYLDLADGQRSFQQMAAYKGATYTFDPGDRPEHLIVGEVTPGFFALLDARPSQGRLFLAQESTRGSDRVVVISHDFWIKRYGGRTDLNGVTLKLNGESYEVVGVLNKGFEWLVALNTDIWVPLVLERGAASRQRRDLIAIARLNDGTSQQAAQAEMTTRMTDLAKDFPEANRGYTVELLNMRYDIPDSHVRSSMILIQVALLFVLLIACANIANLLLSRGKVREREFAVRTSLGANRRRIVTQLLTESLLMAIIAGIIGIALGYAGMRLLDYGLAGYLPSFWLPTLDIRVFVYGLVVTLLGGLLFGVAPVLQTSHFNLVEALKDGSRGSTSGNKRRSASSILVVAEIALAFAFLGGASMMVRTFSIMQTTDPGFSTDKILIMEIKIPESRYKTEKELVDGFTQVNEDLSSLPGVRAVMVSNIIPRTAVVPPGPFEIEGQPAVAGRSQPQVGWISASLGYFQALGIPLNRGRAFAASDTLSTPRVAVVNQAMAERYWSSESPIGRYLTIQGERREIIGIVATVHHGLLSPTQATPLVYIPWAQRPTSSAQVALKTDVEPGNLTEAVRRRLLVFDPAIVVTKIQPLDSFIKKFWVGQQVFTAILRGFGGLALLLAALGTYGVLAYSVAQRTHEIGIRMAIGATRSTVVKMIVRQGMMLGLIGVALGIPLVLVQIKVISAIFAGAASIEPLAISAVAVTLILVTLLATVVPARRAAGVDPLHALGRN